MKKTLLIALILIVGLPSVLRAHAPKKIISEYNSETGILKIEVVHGVKDVNKHNIDVLKITIDGVETGKTYTIQSSKASHIVELEFPDLKKGTIISIYAKCNKMGSKKGKLEVQ